MTLNQCKQGMVFAHANVFAWVNFGAALANNNVTGDDSFATVFFDT